VLLAAITAFAMVLMKRRALAAIRLADESFLGALQNAPHVLSVHQDQQIFKGSFRWQIYLSACRELCFYLLGTDQVEKNFPTRLRAAGRITPSQMSAVTRAMRLALGECSLALQGLSPAAFLRGLALPFMGLAGSLGVVTSIVMRTPGQVPDAWYMLVPAAAPFLLSWFALLIVAPLGNGLRGQLKAHEAALQLFPLALANMLERVFVDHRQNMEELPSVASLGSPHLPSLSLPPTDQNSRTSA
jgi:biopolymer transport protein TolQ